MFEEDPDIIRWGLNILDICHIPSGGSPCSIVHYDKDSSQTEYVREGYFEAKPNEVENDEIIAHTFQEELTKIASNEEYSEASVLSQDWQGMERHSTSKEMTAPEIEDESILDGEVGKRMNDMVPIPHVPKVNGKIPTPDEEVSDHQRLLDRLQMYELVELKVRGDGNCQFRALSDQIYRTADHHRCVRQEVIDQLKLHPESYDGYVPMAYVDYLKHMSKDGQWGDHVTLQAAADAYGVKIFIITSFRDTCYVEILPQSPKSKRIIFLSFWAEVHYNSIYPEGELPVVETKKRRKWWNF